MTRMRRYVGGAALLILFGVTPSGFAQTATRAAPGQDIEADPIRCWWRTSASAVRVGEPFSLVLTCAVVENAATTVVADQSRLEPSAMQLPPFEVVGGQRGPDLRGSQRRFFQYQYTLRLISEDLFGKDARIPSLQVSYYVQSRLERGDSVRGRDRTYILPAESVRVLSLVPADAVDIRDAPSWTFAEIDAQRFRARVLFVVAGVFFTAAALLAAVSVVRFVRQYRQEGAPRRRLISDGAILRGVGRELGAVRRRSEREGWSHELAERALAALRIAATMALGRRVSQLAAGSRETAQEGQVTMRGGWLRGRKVLVSGSATADAIERELANDDAVSAARRSALTDLQTALARFTSAQFGRDGALDEPSLSESLTGAFAALRHLRIQALWVVNKFHAVTQFATELGNRAWSR